MRLFSVLHALSLLGALASPLEPAPYTLNARGLGDPCVNINTELKVPKVLGISLPVGKIDVCLCLSDIPSFLKTNAVAILAVAIVGESVVTEILTSLISDIVRKDICVYPPNSTPTCANGDCGFKCIDGFTPSADAKTCECQSPNVVCNGTCRCWVGSGSCKEMGPGWAGCCVVDSGHRSLQCINTAGDLESCEYPGPYYRRVPRLACHGMFNLVTITFYVTLSY
ncbi:hypothetical protein BC827DRAFT_1341666 [Russula dissimulans]|nr:hypothetical protein BC827DRAFT_1341666 [Russula dissimulans]